MLALCVFLVWPAETLGRALVRFIHALPGVGTVSVEVSSHGLMERLGTIAFAEATHWHSLRSGRFQWSLVKHDEVLARGTSTVGNGAYDMVLLAPQPSSVSLGVYRARGGVRGVSLVRAIHAAPELGSPELKLGTTLVSSSLAFSHATRYLRVTPGVHSLTALAPGNPAPLVSAPSLHLVGGAAYSEILVGTRGERLRWVTVTDRGAPLTRPAKPKPRRRTPPASAAKSVVVRPGDSLWTIAARHLGFGASNPAIYREVVALWNLNARRLGTGDPNLIFPGQVIVFPLAAPN